MNASTDVWVSPAGSYNLLNTTPFAPVERAKLERVAGRARGAPVSQRAARLRRAPRAGDRPAAPGHAAAARRPARAGRPAPGRANACAPAAGWSSRRRSPPNTTCTSARRSRCRRPTRRRFRVAALSTNIGWAPGAIVMNAADYARAWGSQDASAYSILLDPGVPPARAVRAIERALGPALGAGRADAPHSTPPSRARSAARRSRASPRSRR